MPGPQPLRSYVSSIFVQGPCLLLLAVVTVGLMLWPAPTRAEQDEAPVQIAQAENAGTEPAADDEGAALEEEEPESASGGAAIAPPPDVEVIRIKGRAVTAIETDVPESVTQFDAAAIEALGAENISDLAKVTPNVEIRSAGATAATFFIRGVGLSDFSANAAGAVSIYQDDVAKNAPAIQLGQLFDVEQVEVLRGPQGSGSGRNASAGAIKVYSRKPTGETTAQLRSSLGTYASPDAHEALIQDYEGALEVPLVEEMLATRLAFRFRLADPFITNGCGDAPPEEDRVRAGYNAGPPPSWVPLAQASICGERRFLQANLSNPDRGLSPIPEGLPTRVGDQGNWAARGQLRLQPPGTDMDWLLNLHGSRLDQQSTLGQAIGTGNDGSKFGDITDSRYVEPDQGEESCRLRGGVYTPVLDECNPTDGQPLKTKAEVQEELGKNLAEERPLDTRPYRGDYNRVGQTTLDTWGGSLRGDFSLGPVNVTSISGYDGYERFRDTDQDFTPDLAFEAIQEDEAWQFTQELRLFGELEDTPLRWEAGGYYLMENLKSDVLQLVNLRGEPAFFRREYEQNLWSFGVYGGFFWDFLDDFSLEGGIRYNWERKEFDFRLSRPDTLLEPSESLSEKTWQTPTGTLVLKYRPREDVTLYWKYGRGFKAGHYNSILVGAEPARPEFIDAFEVGLRGSWWDGRLGLGGALFYYKYVDYQVFVVDDEPASPPTLEIINANDAEQYGAELDFRLEPLAGWAPAAVDGLVLEGRFGWLESQFLDFTNIVTRVGPAGEQFDVIIDYSRNQLINSPRFKISGAVEWTFELGRWGSIIPRYDFAWTDDIFFDPSGGRGSLNFMSQPNKPEFAVGQPAFWLHNFRLGYRTPEGNIEISAWVRNLADQRYKTYAFDASFFSKVVLNYVGQPRTVGLDLSISW